MDVRCERCKTEYELEDGSVSDAGTEVQCTVCSNTFTVTRAGAAAAAVVDDDPDLARAEWLLETSDGLSHRFRNLTSLQKWIIERKVTRDDRISRTGHAWRRMGEIVELAPFFDVVDEADRAKAAVMTAVGRSPSGPIAPDAGLPAVETDFDQPVDTAVVRRNSGAKAGKALVALAVAGFVAYVGITQWQGSFGPDPDRSAPGVQAITAPVRSVSSPDPAGVAEVSPSASAAAPPIEAVPPSPAVPPAPAAPTAPVAIVPAPVDAPVAPPPTYERLVAEGDRALENGGSGRAQKIYERALRMRPTGTEALAGLGYVALDRGNTSQAFSLFKRALRQNPSFGPALFGLAEVHRASGDDQPALENYRRYVTLDPGGADARVARLQIKTLEAKQASQSGASPEAPAPAAPLP